MRQVLAIVARAVGVLTVVMAGIFFWMANPAGADARFSPLAMLNFWVGVFACAWLIFLGEWGTIVLGFVAGVFGYHAVNMLHLPMIGVIAIGIRVHEKYKGIKGRVLAVFLELITAGLHIVGLAAWCWIILGVAIRRIDSADSAFPILLWSYAVAMGSITKVSEVGGKMGVAAGVDDIKRVRENVWKSILIAMAMHIAGILMFLFPNPWFSNDWVGYFLMMVCVGFFVGFVFNLWFDAILRIK